MLDVNAGINESALSDWDESQAIEDAKDQILEAQNVTITEAWVSDWHQDGEDLTIQVEVEFSMLDEDGDIFDDCETVTIRR